jgi:hypothetical protein
MPKPLQASEGRGDAGPRLSEIRGAAIMTISASLAALRHDSGSHVHPQPQGPESDCRASSLGKKATPFEQCRNAHAQTDMPAYRCISLILVLPCVTDATKKTALNHVTPNVPLQPTSSSSCSPTIWAETPVILPCHTQALQWPALLRTGTLTAHTSRHQLQRRLQILHPHAHYQALSMMPTLCAISCTGRR